ncbi:MAG TPA: aspartate kinase, partial [Blastocatellia bacterium]|nr:aspartate kinase [Blastocatellia bacterium]
IAELKTRHLSEARQLVTNDSGRQAFQLIEQHFDELKKLLEGLAILGEVTPRALDKILSYGELLSSAIVADALSVRGVPSRLLDARALIKTDDRYGAASPIFEITNRNIREEVVGACERGEVPVIQGFIGSTRENATTTLGFEGSDYTAAIIGAAVEADDIQIWKDVSGLMTADPALFREARTVKLCTFAEAAELTYFGAKVLHPKAIHPAAQKNIPVHIYNSKRPSATGTAITATAPACQNLIKSIAYKLPITLITATADTSGGHRAVSAEEFLRATLDTLARRRISPLLTAVSASNIAIAVDSDAVGDGAGRDTVEDLSKFSTASIEPGRAIISFVGEELRKNSAFMARVFAAIAETEAGMIMRGSSPISMNLVVAERDVENVIARLHKVFFERLDPQIFE